MKILCIVALLGSFCLLAGDTGSPVDTPEPSTVILLTAGMAGLGVYSWRRNRKK